jgi:hypothetical protein
LIFKKLEKLSPKNKNIYFKNKNKIIYIYIYNRRFFHENYRFSNVCEITGTHGYIILNFILFYFISPKKIGTNGFFDSENFKEQKKIVVYLKNQITAQHSSLQPSVHVLTLL